MCHRIPYRLLLNLKVLSNTTVRSYQPARYLSLALSQQTHSKSNKFPFFAGVKEYLYLKDLNKDEFLLSDLEVTGTPDKEAENNHTLLYPNSEDPLLESIVLASTIEDVFELTKEQFSNEKYAAQAIVTLWDLHKVYCQWKHLDSTNVIENHINFIKAVKSHPQFWTLVECVEKAAPRLPDEILTSILLCLRKFLIFPWDPLLHSILCTSIARIQGFSLRALSRWCFASSLPSHTGRLILPCALPAFHAHMDRWNSLDDLKDLSFCFVAIAPVIDKVGPTAQAFVTLITQLLDTDVLNRDTPLTVLVRVLRSLYQVAKSNSASSSASIRILYLIQESPQMDDLDSVIYFNSIRKSWEAVSEPIGLVRKMEDVTCRWLETLDIRVEHIDLLNHVSHSSSSDRKKLLERLVMRIMETEELSALEPHIKQIFRIIRASKMSDLKLVDSFWLLVLRVLERRQSQDEDFVSSLLESAQWYMFFNNNLGGTYRSKIFESRILDWIDALNDCNWNQPVRNVRYFCRMSAFVLAYGGYPMPNGLLEKLVEMEEQLTVQDIFYLSRGIQLGRHWLRRPQLNFSYRDLGDLLLVLERRSTALLSSMDPCTLSLTTTLLHSALYRDAESLGHFCVKNAVNIPEVALQKCEAHLGELTARVTRDLVFFLDRFRYLHIPIVDTLIAYTLKNHLNLGPSILVNVLVLCFNMGYSNKNLDILAPITAAALDTKENGMFGLFVLESALALISSNQLPLALVKEIFTVQFLDKLDSEVAACYSKASYPARVRRTLMELNRSVCIDMPEAGVPWFHEKYCIEQKYSNPPESTTFHDDIYNALVLVLGDNHFIKKWIYSAYYHLIDFEVLLNKNGKPISIFAEDSETLDNCGERIAILALLPSLFTSNHGNLSGLSLLRRRQLEILGYRVVGIPHHHWNSLALSSPLAKQTYLKHKLFGKRN